MDASSFYDFSKAKEAYDEAIVGLKGDRHAEVGVLSPSGTRSFKSLGKEEPFGAHRVGSVTKTFTAFLAMKMVKEGLIRLNTKCSEVFKRAELEKVFENADYAGEMTFEQLLSHTSGLDIDDHCRDQKGCPSTLEGRFMAEGRPFTHIAKPGEGIGFYSNAGLAVAGWMMERKYNQDKRVPLSFAEIMKKEIFKGVFKLSDFTVIAPGPTGDNIQSPAGDMTSTTEDLIKVAAALQKGETALEETFGKGWQATLLKARDIFQHHGLGCEANAPVIIHKGLNEEKIGSEKRDVSAVVIFPLHPNEPGLVAMCDSNALGPSPKAQKFLKNLEAAVGISEAEEGSEPPPDLNFYCPEKAYLFQGNAYLAADRDPFAPAAPPTFNCSLNGMKHELTLAKEEGGKRWYQEKGRPWLCLMESGVIYSDLCLVTKKLEIPDLAAKQPNVKSLVGVYRDKDEEVFYTFTEQNGRLYMRDCDEKDSFPCLFIPDMAEGAWVVGNPTGRPVRFRFKNDGSVEITDIFSGVKQRPYNLSKSFQN